MSQSSSQSSQIICTQDIGDVSGWEEEDVVMEPVGWASLISTQNSAERFYCVDDCEYTIGRDSKATFRIRESYVSSIHCSIVKEDSVIFILDHSTNGTYLVHGKHTEKIGKGNRSILKSGDKIILIQENRRLKVAEISFTFIQEIEDNGPDNYFVGKKIGSGAFATVHVGTHKDTLKPVAIKIIKKKKAVDRDIVLREVQVLQKINHSGVVGIESVYENDEDFFLVLELVTGGELFDLLQDKGGFMSEAEARPLLHQIFEVLKYLHENNIVHRDLKLENILLDKTRKQIKISDFGLSQIVGQGVFLTTICGTPEYLAPEILCGNGKNKYGSAVDIWAAGVIMFTLLCGFSPFEPENDVSVFNKVSAGKFEFPADVKLTRKARHLIKKMLTIDPSARYTAEQSLCHPWFSSS